MSTNMTFVDFVTPVPADWLNNVNFVVNQYPYTNLFNYTFPGSGVTRTMAQKFQTDLVSVKDFGAKGDGSTDDTAAINLALSLMGSATLFFPAGTYLTTGPHTLGAGQYIKGAGQFGTTIQTTSLTNDLFDMATNDSGVTDLTVTGSASRTAGVFFNINGGQGGPNVLTNITMTNYFYGIQLNATRTFIENITAINAASTASVIISITGGGDYFINNISADTAIKPAYGLLATAVGGMWVNNCDFIHCTNGVSLQPSGSAQCANCFFNNVACDTSANNSWTFVTSGTATIYSCAFENCWGASATNTGFLAQGNGGFIDTLYFSNWNGVNNGSDGLGFFGNVRNITMVGGVVSGNSQTSFGTSSGINIGANVNNVNIVGMNIGATQVFPDSQLNQILVAAGSGSNINIANCNLASAGHNPITFNATGSSNSISNCGGMTIKGFISTTTDGAGHVAVAHNLGAVPKEVFVNVSNAGAALIAQPDSFTSTGFRITFWTSSSGAVLASSAIAFSWRVEL